MNTNLVRKSNGSELKELVKDELPVLVKFYAPWCAPCRAMEPVFERIAGLFEGRAIFVEINIDNDPDFAQENGVRAVPTFMLFSGGKTIGQLVGATSEKAIIDLLGPAAGKSTLKLAPAV